jgi:hypothetical protein
VANYYHGIGVNKKPLDKFNDGITGEGCKKLIQEVYLVRNVPSRSCRTIMLMIEVLLRKGDESRRRALALRI